MATQTAARRWTRAGVLLPALVALLALADLGARFVPLRRLAFRPWEALREPAGRGAPFLPGRRAEWRPHGDLAALGGVPFPADRRREVFTTDAAGFRNSGNMSGDGPVGVVVLGDSFIAGAGLSDEDTLAARLRETAGPRVFNAGGLPVWTRERLDEVLAISGLGAGGVVVYGLSEPASLPFAPTPRRAGAGRAAPLPEGPGSDLGVSRLGILARRLGSRLAAAARLSPGGDVVRRRLANGDAMLFLGTRSGAPEPVTADAVESWAELREDLGARGIGLLVLLIPGKDVVYEDLLSEPLPPRPPSAAAALARALARRGVPVLDLGPGLRSAARAGLASRRYVYWRDDTHWSPLGVRVAAKELAASLPVARSPGAGAPGRPAAAEEPIPQRSTGR